MAVNLSVRQWPARRAGEVIPRVGAGYSLERWLGEGDPVKHRQVRGPTFGDFAAECENFSQTA